MPTLDEKQREWLDAALAAKGKFTRAASVRKDFENYRRRREKAVALTAGLPDGPQKSMVENGLASADLLAEQGKFASAYKALDQIKGLARNASEDRATAIGTGRMDTALNVITSYVADLESNLDFVHAHFVDLVQQVKALPKCADQPDLKAALAFRTGFATDEGILRGELAGRQDWVKRGRDMIAKKNLPPKIAEVERDIALFQSIGKGNLVSAQVQRLAALQIRLDANGGRYRDPAVIAQEGREQTTAFEVAIKAIKSLDAFQKRDGDSTLPDSKTDTARSGLVTPEEQGDLDRAEKKMMALTASAMRRGRFRDGQAMGKTREGEVTRAPEPKEFDASDVIDDVITQMFGVNGLPNDIPGDQAAALVKAVRAKFKTVLETTPDPNSDEMFDLMLRTPDELAQMCNLALTGVDSPAGLTQSHDLMLKEMGKQLREEVLTSAPNKMADDASEITVNGVKYLLEDVIGQGGNGAARRFRDPATGKTIVVKSLKGKGIDEQTRIEKYGKMAEEMRTHRRALNGGDGLDTDDDNLVKMEGAAVSDDGSLHMIMEDAECGDLTQVGHNITMMESMGLLPPEARKVLALDMLEQTVKGMKAMQERGLVHNDLKPQNLLLTKDGKIKIIDFGESRFLEDDKDTAPSALAGGFGVTPGYEAPEQYGGKEVTSKVDSYALGGIIGMLMGSMDEESLDRDPKPVGSMGRLQAGLRDKDPKKRPSLDGVLMSSMLDQLDTDHSPEAVEDLKQASSEMNMALAQVKGSITAKDFNANVLNGKGMVDPIWGPFVDDVSENGGEVPLAAFQSMLNKFDKAIKWKRKMIVSGGAGEEKEYLDAIADLELKKKFWITEIKRQTDEIRAEGKHEYETAIDDPTRKITVKGKGEMTLKGALAERDRLLDTIAGVQRDFYAMVDMNPELAQEWLDKTNKGLLEMEAEAKGIDAAIRDALGPKSRYYLAEQKLSEVSAMFGPRKVTPDSLKDRATPKPPEQKGEDPVPVDDGTIPEAPPMPQKK
jgi:serine/threonine protein kinase